MKKKIAIILFLLISILVFSNEKTKNVILLIGDGMGISSIDLARQVFIGKDGLFEFEDAEYLGLQKTYSANSLVTDSAAAGTALATGYKTNNGYVGVDPDGKRLKNLVEASKENGKATGLITTVTITHATPAVFSAHKATRTESIVIDDFFNEKSADIYMGGGSNDFDKRSDEFVNAGYSYIKTKDELLNGNFESGKVLGLFNEKALSNYIDRDELNSNEPSLAEMTKKTIDILSKDEDGFFLMVEGGKVDWHNHGHDLGAMVWEIYEFNEAFKVAQEFMKKNPDTLILVTADHETGGVGLSQGDYYYKPEILKMQDKSASLMEKEIASLNDEEIKNYFKKKFKQRRIRSKDVKNLLKYKDALSIGEFIGKLTEVAWTTESHTGQSIPVYSYGEGAKEFKGVYNNTDIPRKIDKVMGLGMFE